MSLNPPTIIGIAGGTGSGKTTVARKVVAHLPTEQACILHHDWYYRHHTHLSFEERSALNFDEPASLDNELLVEHLRALQQGKEVHCPQYDFSTHTRMAETVLIEPKRIVVVEGILLFAIDALREMFDLRIFVDTDDDIRLMRRIKRDIIERGRDIASIQAQYYQTVRPMHKLHVQPSKSYAHLIIPEGGENKTGVDVVVGKLKYILSQEAL